MVNGVTRIEKGDKKKKDNESEITENNEYKIKIFWWKKKKKGDVRK